MTKTGMDAWNAPEMLDRQQYTEKIDMWGAGCIMYFLLMGVQPFCHNRVAKLYKKIKGAQYK
jgi:serine/threonine protein kinase